MGNKSQKQKQEDIIQEEPTQHIDYYDCSICFQNELDLQDELIKLERCESFNCLICKECLLKYFQSKINQLSFDMNQIDNYKYQCYNLSCCTQYDIENLLIQVQDIMGKNYLEKYQEILFKKYMQQNDQMRQCPNNDCKYYGWINLNQCDDNLICNKCGYEWVEYQLLSRKRKIKDFINKYLLQLNNQNNYNMFNQVYLFLKTQQCPQCGIYIQKNGGCSQMLCEKCKCKFCFLCRQTISGHKMQQCNKIQGKNFLIKLTIIILIFMVFRLYNIIFLFIKIFRFLCIDWIYMIIINKIYLIFMSIQKFLLYNFYYFLIMDFIDKRIQKKRYLRQIKHQAIIKNLYLVIMTTYIICNFLIFEVIKLFILEAILFMIIVFSIFKRLQKFKRNVFDKIDWLKIIKSLRA